MKLIIALVLCIPNLVLADEAEISYQMEEALNKSSKHFESVIPKIIERFREKGDDVVSEADLLKVFNCSVGGWRWKHMHCGVQEPYLKGVVGYKVQSLECFFGKCSPGSNEGYYQVVFSKGDDYDQLGNWIRCGFRSKITWPDYYLTLRVQNASTGKFIFAMDIPKPRVGYGFDVTSAFWCDQYNE